MPTAEKSVCTSGMVRQLALLEQLVLSLGIVYLLLKMTLQPFKAEAQTALFKDPVHTALQTLFISVIKTYQFMLQVAQVVVCPQINTKHINTVWAERTVVEC